MKIALHDSDSTGFPNLALMKLSSWHKNKGDLVSFFHALDNYDKIYSSKVFTYTKADPYLPTNTEKGGTGYNLTNVLNDDVEHICPDYGLYKIDYSLGFLTRGCIRRCEYCFVPKKEGNITAHADIEEFTRHKKVVLMDNNVLAHKHGISQIEKIIKLGLRVDFNQGLDARLIDDSTAKMLSKVKWLKPLRLACDSAEQIGIVKRAIDCLRNQGVKPTRYFCYVLVKDVNEALEVIMFLKHINVDPFAQPYIDRKGTAATPEQKQLARWVNHKAIFKSVKWEDYK